MSLTRVYVCGPMTGMPQHNLPAFFDAAATLNSLGYLVENPGDNDGATLDAALHNADTAPGAWSSYLKRDLPRLCKCDRVVVLPGWQKSRGANLEVDVANSLGLPLFVLAENPLCALRTPHPHDECVKRYDLVPRIRAIGLSGYARAGKDTVGKILVEEHGYIRASFADKLREAIVAINPIVQFKNNDTHRIADLVDGIGWEDAKTGYPEVRRLLQAMGTEAGRKILGENVWVDLAFRDLPDGAKVAFTDTRFENEATAIKATGGELWRIERPGFAPVNQHVSETALDSHPFDVFIENDGSLEQLHNRVTIALTSQVLRYAV
jgi:hypothetical protein